MANYPDWVLKHKRKGTYINKVGDKYYLYAAHSERVKGTNKVRRISDGYLGRITEKDGLIPSRTKSILNPFSFELGLSYIILLFTDDICCGLRKSFPRNGDLIYVCSVLTYIYGFYSQELFIHSYLHFKFDTISIPNTFTASQSTGIKRGVCMIQDKLNSVFQNDIELVKIYFPSVTLVKIQQHFYCCGFTETVNSLSDTYAISWEDSLWLK